MRSSGSLAGVTSPGVLHGPMLKKDTSWETIGLYTFRPKLLAESYIILSTFRPVAETYIIYILLIYTIRPIKFFFYCFGQKLQFTFFGQIYLLYVSAKKKVWSCKLLECNPGLSLLWIMDIPLLEGGLGIWGFVICSFFCGA
jgi:hypothetical protein